MLIYDILEGILIEYFFLFGKQRLQSSVMPTSRSTVRQNVFWGSRYLPCWNMSKRAPQTWYFNSLFYSWGLMYISERPWLEITVCGTLCPETLPLLGGTNVDRGKPWWFLDFAAYLWLIMPKLSSFFSGSFFLDERTMFVRASHPRMPL